jgi:uncharacterized protein YfcZ (UPF0381/DUF406 family)
MQIARAALLSVTLLLGCNDGGGASSAGDATPSTSASTSTTAGFDAAKFEREGAAAMTAAMSRPNVEAALKQAWEEIAVDPQVSSAGQALMTAIGQHEQFTPIAAEFMAKLQTSPSFLKLITDFMLANAVTDPSAFEAAFSRHVDAQIARPEVNGALDAVIGRVVAKPEIETAIAKFVGVIIEESGVATQVSVIIATKLNSADVLEKLHGKAGTSPSDPDYEQKLFAYLTEEARLERFFIGFAELFGKHQAPRTAVVELLRSPAVINETAGLVRKMMETPEFYPLAEAALVAALDGSDRLSVESKLEALLNHPQVIAAFAGWVTGISGVPEVKQGCSVAFQQLFTDPEFERLLLTTFVE